MAPVLRRVPSLDAAALPAHRAGVIAAQLTRTAAALDAAGHPDVNWPAAVVPGRIEILGKHTDYAGGRSLVCATAFGICARWAPREDDEVVVFDVASGQAAAAPFAPTAIARGPTWKRYVQTVVRRLARNFPAHRGGLSIAFDSDLPAAAGLSSSSALLVSLALACVERFRLDADASFQAGIGSLEALATYASCIENGRSFGTLTGDGGVGTAGGSEDHVAMLCGVDGHVSRYRFRPVRCEGRVALDDRWTFVVGVSGVVADKGGDAREAYNAASRAAARLFDLWRFGTGGSEDCLADAIASAPDAVERLRRLVDADPGAAHLHDRLSQFVEEQVEVLPAAWRALEASRLEAFGLFVDRSQAAATRWLGNQVPETIVLADTARQLGAVAASSFGAGFGGSVWALVDSTSVPAFTAAWSAAYAQAFPERQALARFIATRPGPGAFLIAGDA